MTDKGSMTHEVFVKFLQHFAKFKPEGNALLILDGAKCHLSIGILEEADKHSVTLFCLPSCTSHELQPLDKSVFRSFEHFWDAEVQKFFRTNPDRSLTKDLFGKIFTSVWLKCMTMSNIQNGFRACGIWPFDEDAIPEEAFAPSALTEMDTKSVHFDQSRPINTSSPTVLSSPSSPPVLHAPVHAGPSGLQTFIDDSFENQVDESISGHHHPVSPFFDLKMGPTPGPSGLQATVFSEPDSCGEDTKADHVSKTSFQEVLKTPTTLRVKKKCQRKKSLNYRATVVSKSLFTADADTDSDQTLVFPEKKHKKKKTNSETEQRKRLS